MRAATPSSRTTNTRASSVAPAQGIVEVGSRSRRNPFIAEETTKKKKRHSASVRLSSYSAAILAAVACSSLLLSVSEAAPQFGNKINHDGKRERETRRSLGILLHCRTATRPDISQFYSFQIGEFYTIQERRVADFEAPKLWKGRSGSSVCFGHWQGVLFFYFFSTGQ